MSIDLLATVQQELGYPELQKIDPNTQKVVADTKTPEEDKFSQAAIPAILTGFYKYVQTDEGASSFLEDGTSSNWMSKLFDNNKKEVVQTIASYAKQSNEDPLAKMNEIANVVVRVVKENLPKEATIKEVKTFFGDQKNNILLYLPADLNIGGLLHDDTLDDATHKMEGPISGLMQSLGAAFTNPVEENKN